MVLPGRLPGRFPIRNLEPVPGMVLEPVPGMVLELDSTILRFPAAFNDGVLYDDKRLDELEAKGVEGIDDDVDATALDDDIGDDIGVGLLNLLPPIDRRFFKNDAGVELADDIVRRFFSRNAGVEAADAGTCLFFDDVEGTATTGLGRNVSSHRSSTFFNAASSMSTSSTVDSGIGGVLGASIVSVCASKLSVS